MGAAKRVSDWFEKNYKQSVALLEPQLASGDSLLAVTAAMEFPSELLTWLPIIGTVQELRKKRFLLGVSRERLIIVQIKRVRIEAIKAEWFPMNEVGVIGYKRHPFTATLTIPLNGTTRSYKEVPHESAEQFKDAVDELQGRESVFS